MAVTSNTNIQRQVGQALAAALSAYEWPGTIGPIEAVWRRAPDYTVEDLGTLKVSVVPGPVQIKHQQISRGADTFEVSVGVVLAQHVGSEQEIEQLEDLVMAIADGVRSRTAAVTGIPYTADYLEIAVPVPFDREALVERSVFLSQIEITYQVFIDKVTATE